MRSSRERMHIGRSLGPPTFEIWDKQEDLTEKTEMRQLENKREPG